MLHAFLARGEDGLDGLRGAHRDGALFDDDLGRLRHFGDGAGDGLDEAQVGGLVRADAEGLGRCVDADEDDVGVVDALLDRGGEEQVPPACLTHQFIETGLVDGQFIRVPGRDAVCVEVHHINADVGALGGDHRHGGSADIAGADAANSHEGEVRSVS